MQTPRQREPQHRTREPDLPSGRPRHRCHHELVASSYKEGKSMTTNKVNISKHTNAIMRQLDLEPTMVRTLTITPHTVVAEVFTPDQDGKKFITDDGYVATDTKTYEVRT